MNKKILVLLILVLIVIGLALPMTIAAKPTGRGRAQCKDGIDNDEDGYTDWPDDPGCANKNDKSELDPNVECDDGSDNDGDSTIDSDDTGCSDPTDDDETDCGDGVCEGGETQQNCPEDCGYPTTTTTTSTTTTTLIPDSCDDTDGGFNITIEGTVYGYQDLNPYNYTDYCNGEYVLTEYFCNYTTPVYDYVNCSCSNGACIL